VKHMIGKSDNPLTWLLKEFQYGQDGRAGYLGECKDRLSTTFSKYIARVSNTEQPL